MQGLGSIGQDLLNAELHADLWRYDDGKYGELLYRSNNLFKKVKRQVFRVFSCDDVPKKRLREMSRSISDLQELFEKEFGVLQEMILKELPFRKRLYFKAYLKLKHKGIVE